MRHEATARSRGAGPTCVASSVGASRRLFVYLFTLTRKPTRQTLFPQVRYRAAAVAETNLEPCSDTMPERGIIVGGIYTNLVAFMTMCE